MKTRVVSEPGFAAETQALLDRIGPVQEIEDYETLRRGGDAPVRNPATG